MKQTTKKAVAWGVLIVPVLVLFGIMAADVGFVETLFTWAGIASKTVVAVLAITTIID